MEKIPETIKSGWPEVEYKFTGQWRLIELGANSHRARRNRPTVYVPVYKAADGQTILAMKFRKKGKVK